MGLRQYHHEQGFSNSCLAACITVVRLRTGEVAPQDAHDHERALCERLGAGRGGIPIESAAVELGLEKQIGFDPDDPVALLRIQEDLASGQWWHIAIMGSGELADHHERLGLGMRSRHGSLPRPVGPPHAIVLVAVEPGEILYLDPWFSVSSQPQSLTLVGFARAWTGMFLPVRLP